MSIEVFDAKQSDIDFILANPINDAFKDYPKMELLGFAKTAIVDGEIIGVGGVVIYWPGVAESWILLSKHAANNPVEMVLVIRRLMQQFTTDHKLWRISASVRVDFPKAQELLEHLGFKYEGLKRKYLPDKTDALMYGWIQ